MYMYVPTTAIICEGYKSIYIINRPVNSPHKGQVARKMFPFDDVIMCFGILRFRTNFVRQSIGTVIQASITSTPLALCLNLRRNDDCEVSYIRCPFWEQREQMWLQWNKYQSGAINFDESHTRILSGPHNCSLYGHKWPEWSIHQASIATRLCYFHIYMFGAVDFQW